MHKFQNPEEDFYDKNGKMYDAGNPIVIFSGVPDQKISYIGKLDRKINIFRQQISGKKWIEEDWIRTTF